MININNKKGFDDDLLCMLCLNGYDLLFLAPLLSTNYNNNTPKPPEMIVNQPCSSISWFSCFTKSDGLSSYTILGHQLKHQFGHLRLPAPLPVLPGLVGMAGADLCAVISRPKCPGEFPPVGPVGA